MDTLAMGTNAAQPNQGQTLSKRGETMAWKTPKITEVSVGMEINCYACAEL
jgi:coenzyme PQQ precursor peptide PqqA